MNSKAQIKLTLPPIFIMVLGLGVVFLSIMYAVFTIASNEAYEREIYITGLGLDLQSLQATGKDINAERYITDAGAYNLVFQGGEVYLRERTTQSTTFLFSQNPELVFTGGEFRPAKDGQTIGPLTIYKHGKHLGVSRPEKVPSPYLLTCDGIIAEPLKTIALDPAHGYDSERQLGTTGKTVSGQTESEYNRKLANKIRAGRPQYFPTRALDKEGYASIETRQKTNGDAIISFKAGQHTGKEDVVIAYYKPNQESKKLACEILNEITKEFRIPVRLVPINFEYLLPQDSKQALKGTRPAIQLEIGNTNNPNSIITKQEEISIALHKGVQQYGLA